MLNFKRILSILMAICLIFAFVACGEKDPSSSPNSNGGNKVTTAKWNKNLSAPGDVFELPNIKSAGDSAPIIAEISKQVTPGTSFTLMGEGFKDVKKAYVYAQNEKGNGKAYESTFVVTDDNTMMINVASDIKYGVFGVYVENSKGTSNLEVINAPKVWWCSFTDVTAGEEFSIYGENLTTDNGDKTNAYIVDGDKYTDVEVTYADPYKVTIKIPKGLEDGKKYDVKLHNGHGGEGAFVTATDKITYKSKAVATFEGKKIDVTKFGANPADDKKDDAPGIQKAIDSAQDGDIIYFPEGVYHIDNPINVGAAIKFQGQKASKTIFNMGKLDENKAMFNVIFGPVEFVGFTFKDVRTTEFKANFINYSQNEVKATFVNLYIHGCNFLQKTKAARLSQIACVLVRNANGIVIENNQFKATKMLDTHTTESVFVRNNNYGGNFYCGPFYSQNVLVIKATNMIDTSNNKVYGLDKLTDDTKTLKPGDLTAGRMFAIQQHVRNLYIANNQIEQTGLPNDNAGEQIMLENTNNIFLGGITASSKDTVTIADNASSQKNSILTVVKGKGVGQWRYVAKQKGKEITVSEPWDIVPDSSSQVMLTACFDNVAIYNNLFDGYVNHIDTPSATCAVQIYGNTHNCFVYNNIMKNMPYGVCVTSHYKKGSEQNGVYWTQIDNNDVENVTIGIRFILASLPSGSGDIPMLTSFGVTVTNNSFKNVVDFSEATKKKTLGGAGIIVGTTDREYIGWADNSTWYGPWENGALIENNKFENNELANILLYKHQAGTVLRNNTVDDKWPVYTVARNGTEPVIMK